MAIDEESAAKSQHVQRKIKRSKLIYPTLLTFFVAETIGTALLLFLGCMGCVLDVTGMPLSHHLPTFTFGLTVMLVIQIFGHISGAHLNPAVTLASVLLGYLKPITAAVYVAAQFLGAIIGFVILKILLPGEYVETEIFDISKNATVHRLGICSTVPHPKMSSMQALALESIITCILILVCCAVWDKRNEAKSDSIPLRFGLIISCLAMVSGPYTGASMNTVRSFAPALINGDWQGQWIYWVGPTIGALTGAGFYKTLFSHLEEECSTDELDAIELDSKH